MIVQLDRVNEEAIEIDTLRVMSFVFHDFLDRQGRRQPPSHCRSVQRGQRSSNAKVPYAVKSILQDAACTRSPQSKSSSRCHPVTLKSLQRANGQPQHVSTLQLPTLFKSASPLAKSHPTITLFWLQQTTLRASNCSLKTRLLLSRWLARLWWACT